MDYLGATMNNFIAGFFCAILIVVLLLLTITPLEANYNECGQVSWNPCYVKVVE